MYLRDFDLRGFNGFKALVYFQLNRVPMSREMLLNDTVGPQSYPAGI